jgi:hypothetical protein
MPRDPTKGRKMIGMNAAYFVAESVILRLGRMWGRSCGRTRTQFRRALLLRREGSARRERLASATHLIVGITGYTTAPETRNKALECRPYITLLFRRRRRRLGEIAIMSRLNLSRDFGWSASVNSLYEFAKDFYSKDQGTKPPGCYLKADFSRLEMMVLDRYRHFGGVLRARQTRAPSPSQARGRAKRYDSAFVRCGA